MCVEIYRTVLNQVWYAALTKYQDHVLKAIRLDSPTQVWNCQDYTLYIVNNAISNTSYSLRPYNHHKMKKANNVSFPSILEGLQIHFI